MRNKYKNETMLIVFSFFTAFPAARPVGMPVTERSEPSACFGSRPGGRSKRSPNILMLEEIGKKPGDKRITRAQCIYYISSYHRLMIDAFTIR